ncbi:hypothetical protein V7O66_01955 [Methanolobus sp. ZRKC3]|uniref:hypothetical protein n=1 Tax=Methanolobus sp. ZRKC3 TaxID=3125786 RepID=UPI003246B849
MEARKHTAEPQSYAQKPWKFYSSVLCYAIKDIESTTLGANVYPSSDTIKLMRNGPTATESREHLSLK